MKADIRILRCQFLEGPNMWTYRPVLETWLDIGDLEAWPSNLVPGLADRLTGLLPGLFEHACSIGTRGGFLQRLRDGTYAGHILEHVVLELQIQAGIDAGFGQTRQAVDGVGIYKMAFRTNTEQSGLAALAEGLALLHAAWNGGAFDTAAAIGRLRAAAGPGRGAGPVATPAGGPLIGIAGGAETSSIAALVARLLASELKPMALLSCKSGPHALHANTQYRAIRTILEQNPYASAIIETDARSIATCSLPYRRCRIGVVSSFAGLGTLDDLYVDRASRLYALLRTQVDVVNPEGAAVLNAQDPAVVPMAVHSDGTVIFYGLDGNPTLLEHASDGGKAVIAAGDSYILRRGDAEWVLPLHGPNVLGAHDRLHLCAALAIAWALDTRVSSLQAVLPLIMQEAFF